MQCDFYILNLKYFSLHCVFCFLANVFKNIFDEVEVVFFIKESEERHLKLVRTHVKSHQNELNFGHCF